MSGKRSKMTRTIRGVEMDVVMVVKGTPTIKRQTFASTKKEEINKLCRKLEILPIWESALLIESVFYMDDYYFMENAEIKSTETRPFTEDVNKIEDAEN